MEDTGTESLMFTFLHEGPKIYDPDGDTFETIARGMMERESMHGWSLTSIRWNTDPHYGRTKASDVKAIAALLTRGLEHLEGIIFTVHTPADLMAIATHLRGDFQVRKVIFDFSRYDFGHARGRSMGDVPELVRFLSYMETDLRTAAIEFRDLRYSWVERAFEAVRENRWIEQLVLSYEATPWLMPLYSITGGIAMADVEELAKTALTKAVHGLHSPLFPSDGNNIELTIRGVPVFPRLVFAALTGPGRITALRLEDAESAMQGKITTREEWGQGLELARIAEGAQTSWLTMLSFRDSDPSGNLAPVIRVLAEHLRKLKAIDLSGCGTVDNVRALVDGITAKLDAAVPPSHGQIGLVRDAYGPWYGALDIDLSGSRRGHTPPGLLEAYRDVFRHSTRALGINIAYNGFSAQQMAVILEGFADNSITETLNLSGNVFPVDSPAATGMFADIPVDGGPVGAFIRRPLTHIELRNAGLGPRDALAIGESITALRQLRVLDLSRNKDMLAGIGGRIVTKHLMASSAPLLRVLNIGDCNIELEGYLGLLGSLIDFTFSPALRQVLLSRSDMRKIAGDKRDGAFVTISEMKSSAMATTYDRAKAAGPNDHIDAIIARFVGDGRPQGSLLMVHALGPPSGIFFSTESDFDREIQWRKGFSRTISGADLSLSRATPGEAGLYWLVLRDMSERDVLYNMAAVRDRVALPAIIEFQSAPLPTKADIAALMSVYGDQNLLLITDARRTVEDMAPEARELVDAAGGKVTLVHRGVVYSHDPSAAGILRQLLLADPDDAVDHRYLALANMPDFDPALIPLGRLNNPRTAERLGYPDMANTIEVLGNLPEPAKRLEIFSRIVDRDLGFLRGFVLGNTTTLSVADGFKKDYYRRPFHGVLSVAKDYMTMTLPDGQGEGSVAETELRFTDPDNKLGILPASTSEWAAPEFAKRMFGPDMMKLIGAVRGMSYAGSQDEAALAGLSTDEVMWRTPFAHPGIDDSIIDRAMGRRAPDVYATIIDGLPTGAHCTGGLTEDGTMIDDPIYMVTIPIHTPGTVYFKTVHPHNPDAETQYLCQHIQSVFASFMAQAEQHAPALLGTRQWVDRKTIDAIIDKYFAGRWYDYEMDEWQRQARAMHPEFTLEQPPTPVAERATATRAMRRTRRVRVPRGFGLPGRANTRTRNLLRLVASAQTQPTPWSGTPDTDIMDLDTSNREAYLGALLTYPIEDLIRLCSTGPQPLVRDAVCQNTDFWEAYFTTPAFVASAETVRTVLSKTLAHADLVVASVKALDVLMDITVADAAARLAVYRAIESGAMEYEDAPLEQMLDNPWVPMDADHWLYKYVRRPSQFEDVLAEVCTLGNVAGLDVLLNYAATRRISLDWTNVNRKGDGLASVAGDNPVQDPAMPWDRYVAAYDTATGGSYRHKVVYEAYIEHRTGEDFPDGDMSAVHAAFRTAARFGQGAILNRLYAFMRTDPDVHPIAAIATDALYDAVRAGDARHVANLSSMGAQASRRAYRFRLSDSEIKEPFIHSYPPGVDAPGLSDWMVIEGYLMSPLMWAYYTKQFDAVAGLFGVFTTAANWAGMPEPQTMDRRRKSVASYVRQVAMLGLHRRVWADFHFEVGSVWKDLWDFCISHALPATLDAIAFKLLESHARDEFGYTPEEEARVYTKLLAYGANRTTFRGRDVVLALEGHPLPDRVTKSPIAQARALVSPAAGGDSGSENSGGSGGTQIVTRSVGVRFTQGDTAGLLGMASGAATGTGRMAMAAWHTLQEYRQPGYKAALAAHEDDRYLRGLDADYRKLEVERRRRADLVRELRRRLVEGEQMSTAHRRKMERELRRQSPMEYALLHMSAETIIGGSASGVGKLMDWHWKRIAEFAEDATHVIFLRVPENEMKGWKKHVRTMLHYGVLASMSIVGFAAGSAFANSYTDTAEAAADFTSDIASDLGNLPKYLARTAKRCVNPQTATNLLMLYAPKAAGELASSVTALATLFVKSMVGGPTVRSALQKKYSERTLTDIDKMLFQALLGEGVLEGVDMEALGITSAQDDPRWAELFSSFIGSTTSRDPKALLAQVEDYYRNADPELAEALDRTKGEYYSRLYAPEKPKSAWAVDYEMLSEAAFGVASGRTPHMLREQAARLSEYAADWREVAPAVGTCLQTAALDFVRVAGQVEASQDAFINDMNVIRQQQVLRAAQAGPDFVNGWLPYTGNLPAPIHVPMWSDQMGPVTSVGSMLVTAAAIPMLGRIGWGWTKYIVGSAQGMASDAMFRTRLFLGVQDLSKPIHDLEMLLNEARGGDDDMGAGVRVPGSATSAQMTTNMTDHLRPDLRLNNDLLTALFGAAATAKPTPIETMPPVAATAAHPQAELDAIIAELTPAPATAEVKDTPASVLAVISSSKPPKNDPAGLKKWMAEMDAMTKKFLGAKK